MDAASTQTRVAVALLDENRTDPLVAGVQLAIRVLENILKSPDEQKYRQLRIANPKVKDVLWTLRGGRVTLLAAGFVESGETVVMEEADVPRIEGVVDALKQLLVARTERDEAAKKESQEQLRAAHQAAQEQRKSMKLGISDDAASRREPGWKPKVSAAAAKGGSAITTATDIGASGSDCC